ncbi:hypothetical protein KHA94_11940 [Bacillus sp. FJAT-49705]|uniref:Uncharacterized protein n=1 Tax=Cytobacillus citreus TaxID=2833586 RepID=A0ABS5NVF8_9BACI|nr:hypothetical protein [Cytobacillus citreus]MBS4190894.1 hypothetical protein [Cytobacillus citreus]
MTKLSSLAAVISEDLNKEESLIIQFYGQFLNGLYKVVLWFGIPYIVFLLIQFNK